MWINFACSRSTTSQIGKHVKKYNDNYVGREGGQGEGVKLYYCNMEPSILLFKYTLIVYWVHLVRVVIELNII